MYEHNVNKRFIVPYRLIIFRVDIYLFVWLSVALHTAKFLKWQQYLNAALTLKLQRLPLWEWEKTWSVQFI